MRTKFLLTAIFVAALMLMSTESALAIEAAAITPEDAMTAAASATLTTPLSATEVTCVDVCEAGTAVALTATFAAIALNTNNENADGQTVMKKPMASGIFNGATSATAASEVTCAAHGIAGAAIAFV